MSTSTLAAPPERPLETGWLPDTPIEDSLLRRYLANQADAQTAHVLAIGGRSEQTAEVALSDTGLPTEYLNQAVLLRPLADDRDPVLDTIDAFYAETAHPAVVVSAWPTPNLRARGWQLVGHPMFVARGPVDVVEQPGPGVEVHTAHSATDLEQVERIVAEGYPMPEMTAFGPNAVLGAGLVDAPVRYLVGCVDGEPVAAAAAHVAHGVVNLCMAATLPAARRRGVWRALVNARCAAAPDLPAASFTSDYSRPGFIRMGFLPITRFTIWARPAG